MPVLIVCHIVVMLMDMSYRVHVCCPIMRMRKRMLMFVRMVFDQRIYHYKDGAYDHYNQCHKVHP